MINPPRRKASKDLITGKEDHEIKMGRKTLNNKSIRSTRVFVLFLTDRAKFIGTS